jgi:hypothetical protein
MLNTDPDTSCAWIYFYCDFRDSKKQALDGILRSLLIQLLNQSRDIPSAVKSLYDNCYPGQPPKPALKNALKDILATFSSMFLILDALDECSGKERTSLLDFIIEMHNEWHLEGLHLLVTSRPEHDIEKNLLFLGTGSCQIDLSASDISIDIAQHVQSVLWSPKEFTFSCWPEDIKELVRKTLIEKADGM